MPELTPHQIRKAVREQNKGMPAVKGRKAIGVERMLGNKRVRQAI